MIFSKWPEGAGMKNPNWNRESNDKMTANEYSKALQQMAALRRTMPPAIHLGRVRDVWLQYAKDKFESGAHEERPIPEGYVNERNHYKQYWPTQIITDDRLLLPEESPFDILSIGMTRIRWAELKANDYLPPHMDQPEHYRFIITIEGESTFSWPETKEDPITMKEGDIYFLNPAVMHTVNNNTNNRRIAILGNFAINDKTKNGLLRIRTEG